jgi:hypothetical protein
VLAKPEQLDSGVGEEFRESLGRLEYRHYQVHWSLVDQKLRDYVAVPIRSTFAYYSFSTGFDPFFLRPHHCSHMN